ncbi:MAG: TlpA disulfide reductase family protein [Candidatus Acidiferrales bacterium]
MFPVKHRAALFFLALCCSAAAACQRAPQEPAGAAGPFTREAEWIDAAGLEQRLAAEKGRVVVVNFWATWCVPCREEFPAFVELERRYASRGLTVLAVSLDSPGVRDTEVKSFLAEMRPFFPVFIKTAGDPDTFINAIDPEWSGVLPATFIYDRSGQRRHALFSPQTQDSLERLVRPLL